MNLQNGCTNRFKTSFIPHALLTTRNMFYPYMSILAHFLYLSIVILYMVSINCNFIHGLYTYTQLAIQSTFNYFNVYNFIFVRSYEIVIKHYCVQYSE